MSTTKELKVRKSLPYNINIRANGKYDYATTHTFKMDNEQLSYTMQDYDGLNYTISKPYDDTTILDFSETVLPWKFELNNRLLTSRYCLKPYEENPYELTAFEKDYKYIQKVGNLSDDNGIFSNFSAENYLKLKEKFNHNYPWSATFKVNLNSVDGNSARVLLGYNSSGLFKFAIYQGRVEFGVSTSTSDWNIGQVTGNQTLQTNKDYWVKAEFTGSVYNIYLSENGSNYSLEGTINSSSIFTMPDELLIGNGGWSFAEYLTGSLDLNETSITGYFLVDGEYIEQSRLLNESDYVKHHTNLGIVGAPTIENNVVSGFSNSNYLTLNNSLVSKNATYVFKVTFPSSMSVSQCIFEQDYFANIEFRGNTQDLRAWNWQNSQYEKIMDITFGKTYWFKMVINDSVKTYSYSEDGQDYIEAYVMNDNATNTTSSNFFIGVTSRRGNIFQGSIDLTESYAKISEIVAEGEGELIEQAFSQPILTENGTMGGRSFAVSADNETNGNAPAYHAFDNNDDTFWRGGNVPGYIDFYNPTPIKVTSISWGFFYSYPTLGNVQGSNDYSDWTTITEFTNDYDGDFTIDMSGNTNSYKYYRINISAVNRDVIHCKNLTIVGTIKGYAVDATYRLADSSYVQKIIKNYTANGSVLINDGIASGFSSSNYLAIPYTVENTNIEFYATITPAYYSGVQDIYDANSNGWNIALDQMKLRVWCSSGQIWGTTILNEGVSYDIKVTIDDNWNTSIYYKESNSVDWILEISGVLDASYYLLYRTLFIGIHSYNRTEPFLGSINLSGCYIKQGDTIFKIFDLNTEQLYGIIDDANFTTSLPVYCYANRDERVVLRNTKTENFDTSDWYLGEIEL